MKTSKISVLCESFCVNGQPVLKAFCVGGDVHSGDRDVECAWKPVNCSLQYLHGREQITAHIIQILLGEDLVQPDVGVCHAVQLPQCDGAPDLGATPLERWGLQPLGQRRR